MIVTTLSGEEYYIPDDMELSGFFKKAKKGFKSVGKGFVNFTSSVGKSTINVAKTVGKETVGVAKTTGKTLKAVGKGTIDTAGNMVSTVAKSGGGGSIGTILASAGLAAAGADPSSIAQFNAAGGASVSQLLSVGKSALNNAAGIASSGVKNMISTNKAQLMQQYSHSDMTDMLEIMRQKLLEK